MSDTLQRWSPQPIQYDALAMRSITELFFGGARGGGKSAFLLADWCADADLGPAWRGVIFRRSYPETEELVRLSHDMVPACWPGSTWLKQERTWQTPSGATLRMRNLEREEDAAGYMGHQYTWI